MPTLQPPAQRRPHCIHPLRLGHVAETDCGDHMVGTLHARLGDAVAVVYADE
jgi:hypothetical protein